MGTILNFGKYLISKKSNHAAYVQMRHDYIVNKNNSIDTCVKINSILNPKFKIKKSKGILGELDSQSVTKISNAITENGYYIFDTLLDENSLKSIKSFMENVPVAYRSTNSGTTPPKSDSYINCKENSTRFDLIQTDYCNENEDILRLITDENFLHIANEYLNAKPILDIIAIWWNKTIPETLSKEDKELLKNTSAQMFHHDMDRLKFIKFFIYITDVDLDTGPHVYVRKSNLKSPAYILKDGRYSDEMISENAGEDVISICGPKGSIIAVDTRGLHKGMEVNKSERLLFQLEFSNSLFGKPEFPNFKLNLKMNSAYSSSYKLYSANKN